MKIKSSGRALLFIGFGWAALAGRSFAFTPEQIAAESAKANAFFEKSWAASVDRSPLTQGYLGIKKDEDKWDDLSDAHTVAELGFSLADLAELKRTVDYAALDPQTQLSYRLFERTVADAAENFKWRFHDYPVNQMEGWHDSVPSFLITVHTVDDLRDAEAYVARLRGIRPLFAQLVEQLETRRKIGVIPPRFVFPLVRDSAKNVITGAPFDALADVKPSPLWEDFSGKIGALKSVDAATKDRLLAEARAALLEAVGPAYRELLVTWDALEKSATDDDGVWKLPEGVAYYNQQLRNQTTTRLTADEIHALGLKEVARIHGEMHGIMQRVGFKGDLVAFFKFMREDPQFYFPNTPEGKQAYLTQATAIIDTMRGRLDELFITKPKAQIVVKAVEPFREKTAGSAFYQQGTPDGSRPGIYYASVYDMAAMPKYEMEALAYHEGIPGHHMQISIAQELTSIPSFRKFAQGYTAYVEGWGLYCEQVPKEMGLYQSAYSDFGRLSMELWRAARLVVDTGLHAKKWTRAQVIDYLKANTPNSERDITTETNRYVVLPGQATAYKVGMMKLLELRATAKRELGAKFDLREYHDQVLRDGPVPLDVLEENIGAWIARKKGS
jgi:uncharacterized protein (DUF885 family)